MLVSYIANKTDKFSTMDSLERSLSCQYLWHESWLWHDLPVIILIFAVLHLQCTLLVRFTNCAWTAVRMCLGFMYHGLSGDDTIHITIFSHTSLWTTAGMHKYLCSFATTAVNTSCHASYSKLCSIWTFSGLHSRGSWDFAPQVQACCYLSRTWRSPWQSSEENSVSLVPQSFTLKLNIL